MLNEPMIEIEIDEPEILGIAVLRDRPISSGFCGNDECKHWNHKEMRAAQAAAETKAKKAQHAA